MKLFFLIFKWQWRRHFKSGDILLLNIYICNIIIRIQISVWHLDAWHRQRAAASTVKTKPRWGTVRSSNRGEVFAVCNSGNSMKDMKAGPCGWSVSQLQSTQTESAGHLTHQQRKIWQHVKTTGVRELWRRRWWRFKLSAASVFTQQTADLLLHLTPPSEQQAAQHGVPFLARTHSCLHSGQLLRHLVGLN